MILIYWCTFEVKEPYYTGRLFYPSDDSAWVTAEECGILQLGRKLWPEALLIFFDEKDKFCHKYQLHSFKGAHPCMQSMCKVVDQALVP